ncbi:uncharacterized protein LOC135376419 isoform X2 [Ornithodoros turicata]|uniref:uncharacterized protein LOC135376419 isoform X2 n=1 Tax=Ornithodoros turicata TaxID=34597 RepID=UPI0031397687
MESRVLRLFFLLICNLNLELNGASATDYVPVEDDDPRSTMYLWRPINVFFIGDHYFRSLQQAVVMPTNVTEFYLFSQSILNAVAFMIREDYPSCDIKLKASGTYVVTKDEDYHFMPSTGSVHQLSDLHRIQDFVEQNTAASLADIVIVLLGSDPPSHKYWWSGFHHNTWHNSTSKMCSAQKLIVHWDIPWSYSCLDFLMEALLKVMHPTGQLNDGRSVCKEVREFYRSALAQERGLMCFNTAETCCVPLFFGMFNIRRESFCTQALRMRDLYGNMEELHCTTYCEDEASIASQSPNQWYWTPPGWVWDQSADYWYKSLLCPKPDDKICSGRSSDFGETLGLTYKQFQRTLTYIWDLDDYEVPDTDAAICRL